MVTASHNPRQDNGIKVYVRDGGQLLPPADADIASSIDAVDPLRLPEGWAEGPFEFAPADDAVDAYIAAVAAAAPRPDRRPAGAQPPGAQGRAYRAARRRGRAPCGRCWPRPAGRPRCRSPPSSSPIPAFPTVPYPNPEEPGVLDLARATAEREGADLVLANDPDADRLAVMVPGPGGWRALTGDELGALLGDAVLTRLASGEPPREPGRAGPPVVATTVVSGSLLRRLAQAAGVRCVTTLTGFKWIARAGGVDGALVYGYEQALGYAVRPDLVADKDGISAALLVLQLAAEEAAGRPHAGRPARRPRPGPRPARHPAAVAAGGRRGRPGPAGRRGRTGQEGAAAAAGRAAGHGDRPARGRRRAWWTWPAARAERSPGQPLPPADVLIWHAGGDARRDDPAERHRARAQDLRRGRPAGAVAGRASRRAGERGRRPSSSC